VWVPGRSRVSPPAGSRGSGHGLGLCRKEHAHVDAERHGERVQYVSEIDDGRARRVTGS